jgi:hypothetical protein
MTKRRRGNSTFRGVKNPAGSKLIRRACRRLTGLRMKFSDAQTYYNQLQLRVAK